MENILLQKLKELVGGPVGSLQESMLTEAQFQTEMGPSWVLSDGRDVTGSRYHTITGFATIPDARGVAIRGKNNGRIDGNENPDGEIALGGFQGDAYILHNHGGGIHDHGGGSHDHGGGDHIHFVEGDGNGAASTGLLGTSGGGVLGGKLTGLPATQVITSESNIASSGAIIDSTGFNENRMKNITANIFIKIN